MAKVGDTVAFGENRAYFVCESGSRLGLPQGVEYRIIEIVDTQMGRWYMLCNPAEPPHCVILDGTSFDNAVSDGTKEREGLISLVAEYRKEGISEEWARKMLGEMSTPQLQGLLLKIVSERKVE